jgi:hypothetical protein
MSISDEIMTIFKEIDVDGDGMISCLEFCTFWNQYVRAETGEDAQPLSPPEEHEQSKATRTSLSNEMEEEGVLPMDDLTIVASATASSLFSSTG